MSLTVQLKSIVDPRIAFEVSLELPPKPTDANETNSKWWVTSYGNLTFGKGTCLASKLKHAYEDALFLVHRMPPTIQSNGREVRGELVYGIPLWGFFGYDGGIRKKGEGLVGSEVRAHVARELRVVDRTGAALYAESGGLPPG